MQVEVSVTRGTHTDVTGTKACESIPGQYASGAQNGARFGPRPHGWPTTGCVRQTAASVVLLVGVQYVPAPRPTPMLPRQA
jgi:hypothetical protein